jgi:para-aminobenzoate synthetase/4-amino-4-deoxychorismate lyase
MASRLFDSLETSAGKEERVRVTAQVSELHSQITPFTELSVPVKLALSRYPLTAEFQETRIKSSARDFYDGERARVSALTGADEVIFFNLDSQLCEGSFTSLFIERNGTRLTPALSCGLLPGVLRQDLIETGKVMEAKLTLSDLKTADRIFVGNSLRGLMPAIFIDFSRHSDCRH